MKENNKTCNGQNLSKTEKAEVLKVEAEFVKITHQLFIRR